MIHCTFYSLKCISFSRSNLHLVCETCLILAQCSGNTVCFHGYLLQLPSFCGLFLDNSISMILASLTFNTAECFPPPPHIYKFICMLLMS